MPNPKPCPCFCELFGKCAACFESSYVPLWQEVYDSVVARAKIAEGSSVLDVGTGTGEVALRLSSLVGRKGSVVAIDAETKMLQIAKRKARDRGFRNLKFRKTSMEAMDLPDRSFDTVVGNYSLCCVMDYKAALAECLRVLKPGGRMTYNHMGPSDPLASQVIVKIFEEYKTRSPSKNLKEIRDSEAAQAEGVEEYRDPFVTLTAMRSVGFDQAEATVAQRNMRYKDAGAFVDQWLLFDWASEAEEIPPEELKRFRNEAIGALGPLSKGPEFRVESDMIFFTGLRR
jgi:O-methyltransferase/aklanonic acid methyltransferase